MLKSVVGKGKGWGGHVHDGQGGGPGGHDGGPGSGGSGGDSGQNDNV